MYQFSQREHKFNLESLGNEYEQQGQRELVYGNENEKPISAHLD